MVVTWTTKRLKTISLGFIILLLSACAAAPTRLDTEEFKLLRDGQVPPESTQVFTDCLMDGFGKVSLLMDISVRQQHRSDLCRVETLAGGSIIIASADVYNDGRVQLFASSAALLLGTRREKEAFDECLKQYGILRR